MKILKKIWVLAALAYFSYRDIKERQLPGKEMLVFTIVGIPTWAMRIFTDGFFQSFSLIPGILFGTISILSQGDLGIGDAWIILSVGMYLTNGEMLVFLILSMFLSMIWAGGVFFKKRNKRQELPFLPFLLAGYVGGIYFWNG